MVVAVVEFAGVAGGGGFCFSLVDALVDCVVVDEEEDEVVLDLFLFRLARVFFLFKCPNTIGYKQFI